MGHKRGGVQMTRPLFMWYDLNEEFYRSILKISLTIQPSPDCDDTFKLSRALAKMLVFESLVC